MSLKYTAVSHLFVMQSGYMTDCEVVLVIRNVWLPDSFLVGTERLFYEQLPYLYKISEISMTMSVKVSAVLLNLTLEILLEYAIRRIIKAWCLVWLPSKGGFPVLARSSSQLAASTRMNVIPFPPHANLVAHGMHVCRR